METRNSRYVSLVIPSRPEYVCVVRLAVSGVACRMAFTYDDIEDLKLAVGEACTSLIAQFKAAGVEGEVKVQCTIEPEQLVLQVCGVVDESTPLKATDLAAALQRMVEVEEANLSLLLMRSLMDEVAIQTPPQGPPGFRLVKRVGR